MNKIYHNRVIDQWQAMVDDPVVKDRFDAAHRSEATSVRRQRSWGVDRPANWIHAFFWNKEVPKPGKSLYPVRGAYSEIDALGHVINCQGIVFPSVGHPFLKAAVDLGESDPNAWWCGAESVVKAALGKEREEAMTHPFFAAWQWAADEASIELPAPIRYAGNMLWLMDWEAVKFDRETGKITVPEKALIIENFALPPACKA